MPKYNVSRVMSTKHPDNVSNPFFSDGSEVSGDENVWDVAEFFILRGYRRHGVGMRVAHELWRRFPGHWEVRVTERNRAAHTFWIRAIAFFMGFIVEASVRDINSKTWHVFSFDTGLAKSN